MNDIAVNPQSSNRWPPRHAWIVGASSGMGQGLAVQLAKMGIKVTASARSKSALETLEKENPNIRARPLDICQLDVVAEVGQKATEQFGPIDLVVLSAGAWDPSSPEHWDHEKATRSMTVNYFGVINVIDTVLPQMRKNVKGHIAIVSSVSGYSGLPGAAYYSPPKAALINLAEAIKPELEQQGIKLQIVNPGFVRTPMTEVNDFPMPFLMERDDAVQRIVDGFKSSRFEIIFPRRFAWLMKLLSFLPYPLYFFITARMVKQNAGNT